MTTEWFQRHANAMVTDLCAVHAQALSIAEDVGEETANDLETVTGAISAAMRLLEFMAERCPAEGFAP